MEKILDIITGKMQAAFVAAGYDASFGRVNLSNRPCDRSLKSEVPCGSCLNWR